MTTDWDTAPNWANYKATDYDGAEMWYSDEPSPNHLRLYWEMSGGMKQMAKSPNYGKPHRDWLNSLEQRP